MEEFASSCKYVPVRELEKYEVDSFDLVKVGEYLGWKVVRLTEDLAHLRSGDHFPQLHVEILKTGELVVVELISESLHGSMAVLESPSRVVFEHAVRLREREEEFKAMVIYNPLGCYIMLKDEMTIRSEQSASQFLVACVGKSSQAVS